MLEGLMKPKIGKMRLQLSFLGDRSGRSGINGSENQVFICASINLRASEDWIVPSVRLFTR